MTRAIDRVQHCHNMSDVRRQIDALDDRLVPLLVERCGYMHEAARIKQHASQVRDEARIASIVSRVRTQAQREGGEPEMIEAIYRVLMEICIAHEQQEFSRLKGSATPINGAKL